MLEVFEIHVKSKSKELIAKRREALKNIDEQGFRNLHKEAIEYEVMSKEAI